MAKKRAKVLATYDPLGAMAGADAAKLFACEFGLTPANRSRVTAALGQLAAH